MSTFSLPEAGRGKLLVSAVALTLLVSGCGSRLTAEERVDQARSQLARGEAPTAVIQLRTVLQQDPSNVEARVLLAEAGLLSGDMETAAKEYRRALDLGAELDDFRVHYAEALVRVGANEEALRVTDPGETGDASELTFWRGIALLRVGRAEEARAALEAAAVAPGLQARARVGLARVALQQQQVAEAMVLLESAAPELARDADYWETLGFALSRDGQTESAAKAFAKAAEVVVDAVGNRRFMLLAGEVEVLLAAGSLTEARGKAEHLYNTARKHPVANYLMARVELQSGNPTQALAHAHAMLAADPNSAPGHTMAGAALLALGQAGTAERHLENAVTLDPSGSGARRLLAQTRLGLMAPQRALDALGPLAQDPADWQTAMIAGTASTRAGDPEAAVEILQRQLEKHPVNDELRSSLAVSLMAAGRLDEALAELGKVSPSDPAARQRADVIAIAAYLQSGDISQAREASVKLAAAHPQDSALRGTLGGVFLSANELDEAIAWFEESLRLDSSNLGARFNLGRIAAALGDLDGARDHFEAIIATQPSNSAALAALGHLAWAGGDREAAVSYAEQARQADEHDVRARVLLVGYLIDLGRAAEAEAPAREAVEIAPNSAPGLNSLGLALLRSGKAREALTQFQRAQSVEPGVPGILVNQARAQLALDNPEGARKDVVNALALDPQNPVALFALVEVERRLGRLDGAAQAFARLDRAVPEANDPTIERVRGELLLAQGDFAAADEAFIRSLRLGGGSPAVLGRYQAARLGNFGDPVQLLQAWLEQHPDDRMVRGRLADHHLQLENYAVAIKEYEKLLANAPDDPALLNNLAWLCNRQGDPRALQFAERAHRLAPHNPFIADTLGWILHKQGDHSRALELIEQAARAAPGAGEIQYHHAVVLAETGDANGAARAARAVLAETGAANYHDAAQKLLEQLEASSARQRE